MALNYGWEKFHVALRGLAIGDIPLRERVGNAFAYRLQSVKAEDLPDDVAAQIAEYRASWRRVEGDPKEGKIAAWANALSDVEATEIAVWIVDSEFKIRGLI